jgi:hypothetical protein
MELLVFFSSSGYRGQQLLCYSWAALERVVATTLNVVELTQRLGAWILNSIDFRYG